MSAAEALKRRNGGNSMSQPTTTENDYPLTISDTVGKEKHFADEFARKEHELEEEFGQMKIKFDKDEREASKKEDKLELIEDETREIANEFLRLKEHERRAETKRMEKLKSAEAKVMAMAAELSEMKKKEGNKEADKLAQIVEHEKMARKIAAELVEAYASDRKLAEAEFNKIENAEKEARETIKNLSDELGKTQKYELEKETKQASIERAAIRKASELSEHAKDKKKELLEKIVTLQNDANSVSSLESIYKDAVIKREAAERVLGEFKIDEERALVQLEAADKKMLKDQENYQLMLKELTNIEAEFEDAELYAESKQQAHEERGKLQMEAAEMANDAFVRVKVLLAKLNQDKEEARAKVEELKELEVNARKHADALNASCLKETHKQSVVNVYEHKRYNVDEKEITVKPETSEENRYSADYIGLMGQGFSMH